VGSGAGLDAAGKRDISCPWPWSSHNLSAMSSLYRLRCAGVDWPVDQ